MAALRQLQALQQQKPAGGGPAGDQGAAAAARAAVAQQNLATAQQRTALTSNQAAVAAQRLATEEQRTATAAAQAAAAQTRAEAAALRLARAQAQAAASATRQQNSLTDMARGAASSVTALLGVGSAIAVISKGAELAQVGAQAEQTSARFEQLAQQAHTTGDAMLAALRQASGGTIGDTALQLDAMKASLLGVAQNAQELGPLLAIARDRAQQMGISVEFAFDSLITGLGRGSRLILDNIGVIVKESEVNERYAAAVGKTVAGLSDQEKKQALINEVIRQGNATIAATGGAVESTATEFQRLSAASDNAHEAVGKLIAQLLRVPAKVTTEILVQVSGGLNTLAESDKQLEQFGATAVEVSQTYEQYGQKIAFVNEQLAPLGASLNTLSESQFNYAKSLIDSGQSAEQATAAAFQYSSIIQAADKATTDWGVSSSVLRDQIIELSGSSEGARMGVESLVSAYLAGKIDGDTFTQAVAGLSAAQEANRQAAAEAERENRLLSGAHLGGAAAAMDNANAFQVNTQAIAENTQQSLQASIQTQQLSQFQALLASLGGQVAAGLMTSANAAAILAGQYNIASGEAMRLIQLQAQLANAQAASALGIAKYSDSVQRMITGGRSAVSVQESQRQADAAIQSARRVADAKRDQVLAVGTANEQIKQREADLAEAERRYGEGSAEAIRAQTALQQERTQQARAAARGGGAARLSDQQKFNNQVAAIDERADNQLEDAEEAHYKKLLDIQKDYEEKSLAQQRANEVNKRASRADFYENLTGATADLGMEEAQRISAEYEAAYQKSQEIAASGNQKLADDYLKMKQRQLDDEVDYQRKLKEAQKNKDKEEVSRLQAVHQLRQDQYAEEEKQLFAAGDANVKARDEQIAEENARYDDQTAHIREQADRAADAKVNAARRGGAAVDAENRAYERQLELLGKIKDKAGEIPTPGAPEGGAGEGTTAPPPTGGAGLRAGGAAGLRAGGTNFSSGVASGSGLEQALAIIQEASQIIVVIAQTVRTNKSLLSLLNQYAQILQNATTVLTSIADLRARLAMPQTPLDMAQVQQLANEQAAVVDLLARSINPAIFSASKLLEKYKAGVTAAVEILQSILELRERVAKTPGPIDPAVIQRLAAEAVVVTGIIMGQLVKLTDQDVAGLKRYADSAGSAIEVLTNVGELARSLADPLPPVSNAVLVRMAIAVQQATRAIQVLLIPLAQAQADELMRYAEAAQGAIGVLKEVADLGKALAEPIPPIPNSTIVRLAFAVQQATRAIQTLAIPMTEEQTAALKRYQESAGASISALKDVVELGKALGEPVPPLSPAFLERLATTARQATQIVLQRALPVSEEQAAALKRYAETTGAAIAALKDTLELPAKMFTDYQSPSDAQIDRVVADANRIVRRVDQAARIYGTEGLEAAKAFGEATSSVLGAFKEQLLFAQALNSGDFIVNSRDLAIFEQGMARTLAVAGRLGAQAAAIPTGNIAALQSAATALTASYDSMIRLAAVPFGNIPQLTGGLGGGSSTTNYFNNTFILPPGTTQQMGQQILGHLRQQLTMRK